MTVTWVNIIIALAQGILLVLLAPLVSGITRWMRAKMHTRKGPSIFQDYYDISKLLKRQDVHSNESGRIHKFMPPLYLATMFVLAMGMPMVTLFSPIPWLADVILIVYLLAVPRFFFALSGIDSGSAYAGTGSVRELILSALVEPGMMLALFVAALAVGSTNIGVMGQTVASGGITSPIAVAIAGIAFAVACYMEMGKDPYDLAEAEQELQEGPLSEYSGPSLAMIKLSLSMKQILVACWFIAIFFPFGAAETLTVTSGILGFVFLVIKIAVIFFITTIVENSVSRVRFNRTGKQTWTVFAISVVAFAFCAFGL